MRMKFVVIVLEMNSMFFFHIMEYRINPISCKILFDVYRVKKKKHSKMPFHGLSVPFFTFCFRICEFFIWDEKNNIRNSNIERSKIYWYNFIHMANEWF